MNTGTVLLKDALTGLTAGAMVLSGPASDLDAEQPTSQPMTSKFVRFSELPSSTVVQRPPTSASPAYLAAKRRAQCKRISSAVESLKKWERETEFSVWTHEPLSLLRNAIKFLDDAEQFAEVEHEGNSCEVLRQIRDTFHKRGFERYRDESARRVVIAILNRLAADETVGPEFADSTIDQLLDLDLLPIAREPMQHADEEGDS
jgi:hypothetical protein